MSVKDSSRKMNPVSRGPDKDREFVGKSFGTLTVISVFKDDRGHKKCRCRCQCGKEKDIYLVNLTSGRTRSCGCVSKKKPRPPVDIQGKRFGKLIAIEPTEERDLGSVVWRCKCDCGREAKVSLRKLSNGTATSCGCEVRKKGRAVRDLAGKRFGQLTVVSQTDKRSYKGSVIWVCRCDCGKMVDVPSDELVNGNSRSCGCLKAESAGEARQNLHFVDGTCIEWLETRRERSDNTTGHKGVSRRKNGAYMAKIGFKNRQYYLGTYRTMEEAVAAREEAEAILFGNFLDEYHEWEASGAGSDFHFDQESTEKALEALTARRNT